MNKYAVYLIRSGETRNFILHADSLEGAKKKLDSLLKNIDSDWVVQTLEFAGVSQPPMRQA